VNVDVLASCHCFRQNAYDMAILSDFGADRHIEQSELVPGWNKRRQDHLELPLA
jgi:hypothetical protein